jgi:hypothetical protein
MDSRTGRQRREQAAYHFELQAERLYLSVLQRLTNYRYRVRDTLRGVELTAMVLSHTFDFYEYRLNKGKQRVDLLIVQQHNAVVPLPVLCLADSRFYDPGQPPATTARPGARRRNAEERRLLLSKLLLGLESATDELARLSPRSRRRYATLCREYLKPRVGRPWAS